MIGVLGVARPLLRDAYPAGEADPAVDDQQLAVGAVLQAPHGVGPERTKPAERHSGIAHLVDQRAVHLRSAEGIDDHVALDARARPVAQSLRDIDRDVALPVGVGEQVDRLFGTRDGAEVGGEDLVAVDEQLDVVAIGDGRAGQRLGSAQEVRLGSVHLPAQLVAVAALAPVAQAVRRVPGHPGRGHARRPGVASHLARVPCLAHRISVAASRARRSGPWDPSPVAVAPPPAVPSGVIARMRSDLRSQRAARGGWPPGRAGVQPAAAPASSSATRCRCC